MRESSALMVAAQVTGHHPLMPCDEGAAPAGPGVGTSHCSSVELDGAEEQAQAKLHLGPPACMATTTSMALVRMDAHTVGCNCHQSAAEDYNCLTTDCTF